MKRKNLMVGLLLPVLAVVFMFIGCQDPKIVYEYYPTISGIERQ